LLVELLSLAKLELGLLASKEIFSKILLRNKLSLGRIAFGKNCRGRILWERIHREELIKYANNPSLDQWIICYF
jgi:hypothetical protein